jgi:phosphatidylinositol glycan class Q protein
MGVPAGLKLNDHLDFCLGNLCMLGIECYQVLYRAAHPLLPLILVSTAVSGAFGVTVMLCVMSDLLSLATLHIRLFYSLAARWHGLQTKALTSLWRLFRGKKRNVLRRRIDACHYSMDQLLLGTLLFTVLVFLFPTTFVYYLLFFLVHSAVCMIQGAVGVLVGEVNHFPIFAVLQRLVDARHLPGGVTLELLVAPSADSGGIPSMSSTNTLHAFVDGGGAGERGVGGSYDELGPLPGGMSGAGGGGRRNSWDHDMGKGLTARIQSCPELHVIELQVPVPAPVVCYF